MFLCCSDGTMPLQFEQVPSFSPVSYALRVGWMQVEIMMALEEKFDIQLDEDNAEKIVTVQHAADLIHDVVAAKKA